jgi:hypothetical protein
MEYQLIRIDQLPNGTINLNSPVMFGNGQFIEKTTLSNLLALIPAPTINTKMSLTDLEITVLESDLSTFLSGVSLTIAAGDVKLIRFAVIKSDGRLSRFTYGVPLSAGTYASLGNEITFDDLILINEEPITENVSANTITYSYPSIEAVNALDPSLDLSDEDFVYILILGGVPFQFIGTNGFYGANDLQLVSEDLQLLTSELLADQDNLPIKIDLTLADLGLTEIGTDAEMNTALKAYFTANNLTVDQKQIPHIRIFDELPSAEPYLRLEFDDLDAFVADRGGFDKNSLSDWNDDITDTWYFGSFPAVTSDFTNLEINGNEVILSGGQAGKDTKILLIPPDAGVGGYLTLVCEIRNFESLTEFQCYEMYSNPLIIIQNSPLLGSIDVSQNDFTSSRFDENFADFAENTTVTGGDLNATGTAEDISGTDAIAEFTAKTWTINID